MKKVVFISICLAFLFMGKDETLMEHSCVLHAPTQSSCNRF